MLFRNLLTQRAQTPQQSWFTQKGPRLTPQQLFNKQYRVPPITRFSRNRPAHQPSQESCVSNSSGGSEVFVCNNLNLTFIYITLYYVGRGGGGG
jgi:hypothetical protein